MNSDAYRILRALFDEAVELSGAELERFLEDRCGDDPALRDSLQALLADDRDGHSILDAPPGLEALSDALEQELDPKAVEVPGYTIRHVLGEGGFGVVYAAEQLHPVRRTVALKLIKQGSFSSTVRARFSIECQALASLEHPSIARVYDAGTTPSGHLYCALELIEGLPIVEFANQHTLSVRSRIELVVAACQAMQHAHQRGILHRDLKPSNILVTQVDGQAVPKIIDFGIAKVRQGADDQTQGVTLTGEFVGTPAYMSPEQFDPGGEGVDTRSDVYSLGVLLYELLTGTTPIRSPQMSPAGLEAALRALREDEVPLASSRLSAIGGAADQHAARCASKREALVRMLHGDLDRVIAMALEKDSSRRYESPQQFAADLSRVLCSEPVLARSPTATYLLRKFARRHRGKLAAGAAALVLLLAASIGTTIALIYSFRAQENEEAQRKVAEREGARARQEARISGEIEAFLNDDLLAAVMPDRLGIDVTVRETLDAASERIGDRFTQVPAVEVALRTTLGSTYLALGVLDTAMEHLARACDLAARHLDPADPRSLRAFRELGVVHYQSGHGAEAERLLRDVLARSLAVLGERHEDTIAAAYSLAAVCADNPDQTEARALVEHWRPISSAVLGPAHPQTIQFSIGLTHILLASEDIAGAREILEEASRLARQGLGAAHRLTLMLAAQLAEVEARHGSRVEAQRLYRQAIADASDLLGPRHPVTLNMKTSLWGLLSASPEQSDEVHRLLDELIALWPSALPGDHPLLVQFRIAAAAGLVERKQEERAVRLLNQVVAALEGKPSAELLQVMQELATLHERGGDVEAAAAWRARGRATALELSALQRDG